MGQYQNCSLHSSEHSVRWVWSGLCTRCFMNVNVGRFYFFCHFFCLFNKSSKERSFYRVTVSAHFFWHQTFLGQPQFLTLHILKVLNIRKNIYTLRYTEYQCDIWIFVDWSVVQILYIILTMYLSYLTLKCLIFLPNMKHQFIMYYCILLLGKLVVPTHTNMHTPTHTHTHTHTHWGKNIMNTQNGNCFSCNCASFVSFCGKSKKTDIVNLLSNCFIV